MNTDRITQQAKEFDIFTEFRQLNEHDISSFITENKFFIDNNQPGYGCWIWKPKIIYDTLNDLSYGDIIFYADAGTYLNSQGKKRMYEYINIINDNDCDLLTFSTSEYYIAQNYVGIDAVMDYYPDFLSEKSITCYAGIMFIKKQKKH